MKCLKRNQTRFEFIPYSGNETDLNEDGEHTGEFHPDYSGAIPYYGSISAPSGKVNQTFYGMDIRYTHTLVMDKPDVDINEYGVVRWKGELYDVVAVRPSLNFVSIALRKQTVDHSMDPKDLDIETGVG